jgi:hypothetical protein
MIKKQIDFKIDNTIENQTYSLSSKAVELESNQELKKSMREKRRLNLIISIILFLVGIFTAYLFIISDSDAEILLIIGSAFIFLGPFFYIRFLIRDKKFTNLSSPEMVAKIFLEEIFKQNKSNYSRLYLLLSPSIRNFQSIKEFEDNIQSMKNEIKKELLEIGECSSCHKKNNGTWSGVYKANYKNTEEEVYVMCDECGSVYCLDCCQNLEMAGGLSFKDVCSFCGKKMEKNLKTFLIDPNFLLEYAKIEDIEISPSNNILVDVHARVLQKYNLSLPYIPENKYQTWKEYLGEKGKLMIHINTKVKKSGDSWYILATEPKY